MNRLRWVGLIGLILGTLAACGSAPRSTPSPKGSLPSRAGAGHAPTSSLHERSRWTAVSWGDLPGFEEDDLSGAWNAWLMSCKRSAPAFAPLCKEARGSGIEGTRQQRDWLTARLQPYRVEAQSGGAEGLLTAYFEPMLEASRIASAGYSVPLYRPPAGLTRGKPWYTRQQMETLPAARAALAGREIVYLANPIDALILQIQGSGQVHVRQADGSHTWVRLAFAGSNEQPYHSVGRWLLDQGAVRDASWPAIKAWVQRNPKRLHELLWSNPRTVFFNEEPISAADAGLGPKGAQGIALTPGRSIAVDPLSIPLGTPVWLVSNGAQVKLKKLVVAQDTGTAITGAVRADYFVGTGASAEATAGRLKQPLQLWVLWPK